MYQLSSILILCFFQICGKFHFQALSQTHSLKIPSALPKASPNKFKNPISPKTLTLIDPQALSHSHSLYHFRKCEAESVCECQHEVCAAPLSHCAWVSDLQAEGPRRRGPVSHLIHNTR